MMTDCEKQHQVPSYVLESFKPIWNGELKNCDLRFCVINSDGYKVMPERVAESSE